MRRACLIPGLLVLAALWLGPLPALAEHAFWAHMTVHMGVVAVAAPLLAGGLAGGRLDPVPRAPRLVAPVPASMVEFVVVWAWHAPALHHFGRASAAGFAFEQGTFLASGLFLWLAVLGGRGTRRSRRRGAGVVALLLTAMHMTLLGVLLSVTTRTLYHSGSAVLHTQALHDQHLGGLVMLVVGGVVYGGGGLWLTAGLLRDPKRREEQDSAEELV